MMRAVSGRRPATLQACGRLKSADGASAPGTRGWLSRSERAGWEAASQGPAETGGPPRPGATTGSSGNRRSPERRASRKRITDLVEGGQLQSNGLVPHAFAVQSFVAELAAAAGRDQKEFLLEVIGPPRRVSPQTLGDTWNHDESPERYPVDTGRLRRVVETAAREAGWVGRCSRAMDSASPPITAL